MESLRERIGILIMAMVVMLCYHVIMLSCYVIMLCHGELEGTHWYFDINGDGCSPWSLNVNN